MVYTGLPTGLTGMLTGRYRTNILGYFRKAYRKVPKFPKGKEFLINVADTREIEYVLITDTKENRICGNSSIYVSERQTAELMVM